MDHQQNIASFRRLRNTLERRLKFVSFFSAFDEGHKFGYKNHSTSQDPHIHLGRLNKKFNASKAS